MARQAVNQLMLGARGGQCPLIALSSEILQSPRSVLCLVRWIDWARRALNTGQMEAALGGHGGSRGFLQVTQGFEG